MSSLASATARSTWTDDRIDTRGNRSNRYQGAAGVPIHGVVGSFRFNRLLSALRLSSIAGDGLPERMRSISFALLGLTAAAGLSLVAIFAQPDSQLLSPSPLPDQPSAGQSIAAAKNLSPDRRLSSLVPARASAPLDGERDSAAESNPESSTGAAPEDNGGSSTPAGATAPTPVSAPDAAAGHSPGSVGTAGSGGEKEAGGDPSPAPVAAPQAATSPPSVPASPSQPPKPTPEVTTSNPQPEPAPAPGNSSSTAAAAHASERGIEASASSPPTAGGGATTAGVAPESSAAPGNGNGLAKGHDK
jgi:hypothetical protein